MWENAGDRSLWSRFLVLFVMKASRSGRASGDFFRDRFEAIIDMRHPLVRLGRLMTRWRKRMGRKRVGSEEVETLLKATVAGALSSERVTPSQGG